MLESIASKVRSVLDGPLADFVIYHRRLIVAATVVNIVVMGFLASRIRSPTEATQLFPPSYPRMRYQNAEFDFAAGQLMESIPLSFAFGVVPYPSLSRRDPSRKDVGPVHFDPNFDIAAPTSQAWMLEFCNSLSSRQLALRLRFASQRCAMSAMDEWLRQGRHLVNESLPLPRQLFQKRLGEWLALGHDTGAHDLWQNFYFHENASAPAYFHVAATSSRAWRRDLDGVREEERFWQEWMARQMATAPPGISSGLQTSSVWQYVETFDEVRATASLNLAASLALAFLVLLISTRDLVVSVLATTSIGSVVATVLGTMQLLGWSFGITVSICTTVLVGLSVDYTVHIANAYVNSGEVGGGGSGGREARIRVALRRMGLSVISGAVTTIGAAVFLLGCIITFFDTFGKFMCVTLIAALVHALIVFPALCACVGSEATASTGPANAHHSSVRRHPGIAAVTAWWPGWGARGQGGGWTEMSTTV